MTLSTSSNKLPPDLKLSWSILGINKKPYANDHSIIITVAEIWTRKVRIREYIECQPLLGKDHNERTPITFTMSYKPTNSGKNNRHKYF